MIDAVKALGMGRPRFLCILAVPAIATGSGKSAVPIAEQALWRDSAAVTVNILQKLAHMLNVGGGLL